MFGRISKSAIPEPDATEWILEVYAWLLTHSGGCDSFAKHPLALPTDDYFPVPSDREGHELALALFERTRALAKLERWPCPARGAP